MILKYRKAKYAGLSIPISTNIYSEKISSLEDNVDAQYVHKSNKYTLGRVKQFKSDQIILLLWIYLYQGINKILPKFQIEIQVFHLRGLASKI